MGSGAGTTGGFVYEEVAGDGSGIVGGAEGGRSVCTAGAGLSARAVGVHGGGYGSAGGAEYGAGAGSGGGRGDTGIEFGYGMGRGGGRERRGNRERSATGKLGVCDLHLRFHGKTQRGDEHTQGVVQSALVDAAAVWSRRKRSGFAKDSLQFRRVGMGVSVAADDRRAAGRGATGRASGQPLFGGGGGARTDHHHALCALDAASIRRRERDEPVREFAASDLQRRSVERGVAGAFLCADGSGVTQSIRADGSGH